MSTLAIDMRPTRFEDVIGNEKIVAAIKNQIDTGRLPVAWLFSGSPGVGKTTLAHIIARYIQGPDFTGTPDIRELNASDQNGIADMRELIQSTSTYPLQGKFRIIILDEAQRLTEASQNALLKPTEALGATIYVFCTTSPDKIIPALKSRCLSFHLSDMDDTSVEILINKATVFNKSVNVDFIDVGAFTALVLKSNIRSPREILQAVDRYISGMSAEASVQLTEKEPLYFDIAKSIGQGSWLQTRKLLMSLKAADVRGLRAVVASYIKSMLLNGNSVKECTAYSNSLELLLAANTFEDGIAYAGTVGAIYKICREIASLKETK